MPIIFFTTGLHPDYHANTDEVSKIEFDKMTRITQLVYETGLRVANLDHAPARDNKGRAPAAHAITEHASAQRVSASGVSAVGRGTVSIDRYRILRYRNNMTDVELTRALERCEVPNDGFHHARPPARRAGSI